MNDPDKFRNDTANLEVPGSPEHRAMGRVLASAGVPEPPQGFAQRLQRHVEDQVEQSRWEQGALSLLLIGMAAAAIWQLDLGWLAQLALPDVHAPMLPIAGAACLAAWVVDRVLSARSNT